MTYIVITLTVILWHVVGMVIYKSNKQKLNRMGICSQLIIHALLTPLFTVMAIVMVIIGTDPKGGE